MNCTRDEFITKVHAKHPHKHISDDVFTTSIGGDIHTVYMLDTYGECKSDIPTKDKLASHIWRDGTVMKDIDGLFSSTITVITNTQPLSITPGNIYRLTYVGHNGNHVDLFGNAINKTASKVAKCECGSHAVGSNKHSSWCAIKE